MLQPAIGTNVTTTQLHALHRPLRLPEGAHPAPSRPWTHRGHHRVIDPALAAALEISRRRLLLAGAATALLAACGGDDGGAAAPSTRTVEGSRGPVQLPTDPQRVAALVGSADIDVITLGIEPVFSGSYARGWVDIPATTRTSDLIPPNPEDVAAVTPDLLIGWDWLAEDSSWSQLSAIAPAITLPEAEGTNWRDVYLTVADAVNRRPRGLDELAAFDARVAELRTRITARGARRVNYIGVFEPGTYWQWSAAYPSNEHLAAAGFEVDAPAEDIKDASVERLPELTAPWIIVSAPGDDDGPLTQLQQNPLWQKLPAVQADQVIVVDRDLWGGAGLLWARALLDDVERLFLS